MKQAFIYHRPVSRSLHQKRWKIKENEVEIVIFRCGNTCKIHQKKIRYLK